MKNLLLTLMLAVLTTFTYAQLGCSPDPQFIAPGIYPDTATGLSDAFVAQAYSENITIIVPVDTAVDFMGQSIVADFLSIELTNVTGLPSNFAYACDPPNCIFPGASTKCAEVYSTTDPTISDIGFYPITFECIAHLEANVLTTINVDCTYVESGYSIEIVDNMTSVINQFNSQTFELRSPTPNPVIKQAQIQFVLGESDDIVFSIYNLLGKQVYLRKIKANRGLNTVNVNTSSYPEGLYLYSINNANAVLTKRMIVKN